MRSEPLRAPNELGPSASVSLSLSCTPPSFCFFPPFSVSSYYSLSLPRAFFRPSSSVCTLFSLTYLLLSLCRCQSLNSPLFSPSACSISHSAQSSLFITHFPLPSLFLLRLSCAFEIPFSSLALSSLSLTQPRTRAHSVILLLSQN